MISHFFIENTFCFKSSSLKAIYIPAPPKCCRTGRRDGLTFGGGVGFKGPNCDMALSSSGVCESTELRGLGLLYTTLATLHANTAIWPPTRSFFSKKGSSSKHSWFVSDAQPLFFSSEMCLIVLSCRGDSGLLVGVVRGWRTVQVLGLWTENPILSRTPSPWPFCEAHSLSVWWTSASLLALSAFSMSWILDWTSDPILRIYLSLG